MVAQSFMHICASLPRRCLLPELDMLPATRSDSPAFFSTIDRSLIDRLLAEADTTRQVIVEHDVLAGAGGVVAKTFPDRLPVIIADKTTWNLAGAAISASIEAAGLPQ